MMLWTVSQERQAACTGRVNDTICGEHHAATDDALASEMRPISEQSEMACNVLASSRRGANGQIMRRLSKLAPMDKFIR